MSEPTIESLQALVDELNQKLATASNLADAHQQEMNNAQHQIDIVKEECAKQIVTLQDEHNAKCRALIDDTNKAIDTAQKFVSLYKDRWDAQNIYVIALEKQSPDDVAAALQKHEAAKRALQIQILQSQG